MAHRRPTLQNQVGYVRTFRNALGTFSEHLVPGVLVLWVCCYMLHVRVCRSHSSSLCHVNLQISCRDSLICPLINALQCLASINIFHILFSYCVPASLLKAVPRVNELVSFLALLLKVHYIVRYRLFLSLKRLCPADLPGSANRHG